jgi:hypothetical protein
MQNNLPHCITQRHRSSSVVSHNARNFPPLWDTTEETFPVVRYNGRGFPPLWDTTEAFFCVGYNRKGFFPLWDTTEINDTTKNDILKF